MRYYNVEKLKLKIFVEWASNNSCIISDFEINKIAVNKVILKRPLSLIQIENIENIDLDLKVGSKINRYRIKAPFKIEDGIENNSTTQCLNFDLAEDIAKKFQRDLQLATKF